MSNRAYVATRKGLFTLDRADGKWTIAAVDFLGDNVNIVLEDPRDGWLYAAKALGHFGAKLHHKAPDGEWEEVGAPIYPEMTDAEKERAQERAKFGQVTDFGSLKEIWGLAAGGDADTLWAGTIPGALFRSSDRGSSWELIDSLWQREERWEWFGGGKDDPGIHSICVDPRNAARVQVAVSCGGVWTTTDNGGSWECTADGMRAEYMPPEKAGDPNIQDPHLMVQCPADPDHLWVQHHNGIFRSTDGAQSWTEIEDVSPSAFGFPVAVHPHNPLTAWVVPAIKDECRVPVDGRMVVNRTDDGGQSWQTLWDGLPQKHCYDIVFRHALDVDSTGESLLMGSSTGALWSSDDGGRNWATVATHLPQVYCVRFGRP